MKNSGFGFRKADNKATSAPGTSPETDSAVSAAPRPPRDKTKIRRCQRWEEPLQSAPVLRILLRPLLFLGVFACLSGFVGHAEDAIPQPLELLISVAEQRLVVLHEGAVVGKFNVSTSRFGLGDSFGSYKTPLGRFKVCDKVGEDLPSGTVIKHRTATNEVLPVNAAGRDPIVTRVLWLDGLDEQNRNAKARGIYIHGTTEESKIGAPVSYGCIRMRSRDIIELFRHLQEGSQVAIIPGKLPKLRKYVPAPPVIIASNTPVPRVAPEVPAKKSEVWVSPTKPAPRLASKSNPQRTERLSEIAESGTWLVPADAGAAQAMKGSILSAGLPDGPERGDAQKQGTMKFHSWSTVSLRDVEAGGKTTNLR